MAGHGTAQIVKGINFDTLAAAFPRCWACTLGTREPPRRRKGAEEEPAEEVEEKAEEEKPRKGKKPGQKPRGPLAVASAPSPGFGVQPSSEPGPRNAQRHQKLREAPEARVPLSPLHPSDVVAMNPRLVGERFLGQPCLLPEMAECPAEGL